MKRTPEGGRLSANLDRKSPNVAVLFVELEIKFHVISFAVVDAVDGNCIVADFVDEVGVVSRVYIAHGGLNRSTNICQSICQAGTRSPAATL